MSEFKRVGDYAKMLAELSATGVILYEFIHVIDWIITISTNIIDKCGIR